MELLYLAGLQIATAVPLSPRDGRSAGLQRPVSPEWGVRLDALPWYVEVGSWQASSWRCVRTHVKAEFSTDRPAVGGVHDPLDG